MHAQIRRWLLGCLSALLAVPLVAFTAPDDPAWHARVDRIFAEWARSDSPGCALGVFKDGAMAYQKGYGIADLEHDVPITPASVFYVGSVSKQFTAMTAALAMQEGQLAVSDSIRKYLPELPEYASAIQVHHLIHHTSGLRDYNTLLSIAGRRGDEAYDNAAVLRITARQKHLNFTPGDEYLYSNTGYTLLATIVERATGTPFARYADEKIFKPLGMSVTHYHVDSTRVVKNRALAFERDAGGVIRLDTPSNERAGAGGLYTNLADLLRWDSNFYDARVGGPEIIKQLQTTEPLNSGRTSAYAWGLEIATYRGLRIVEHGGSLGGYRAHILRFPERRTTLALLCNLGSIVPANLARSVADEILPFTEAKPAARETAVAIARAPASFVPDPAPLTDYAGDYYSDEIDSTFTVVIDEGRLMLRRDADTEAAAMQVAAPGEYRVHGLTIRFVRRDGRVTALGVDAGRVRDIEFARKKN